MSPYRLMPLFIGLATLGALPEDCETEPPPDQVIEDCSDQTRVFYAWDQAVQPPVTIEVPATCRLVGPQSYLYVADDMWETYVNDEIALTFMETMEFDAGPDADLLGEGMIVNNQAVFGDFPDEIDNDPRVYWLLMDIHDYTNSEGTTFQFDGYFSSLDEMPDDVVERITQGWYRSNEVEMLYLNARIRPADDPYTLAVAAHEMQHLIQYNYDDTESLWMGEALAEVAMLINGYYTDEPWVESYASKCYTPLVTGYAGGSYGAYLLWGMYIYEQMGRDFMLPLESQKLDGIEGLNAALTQEGFDTDFKTLFSDWIVANEVNTLAMGDGLFGYEFTDYLPPMARIGELGNSGDRVEGELESFGVAYVDITPSPFARSIEVESDGPIEIRFISKDGDEVLSVTDSIGESEPFMVFELEPGQEGTFAIASVDEDAVDTGVPVMFSLAM